MRNSLLAAAFLALSSRGAAAAAAGSAGSGHGRGQDACSRDSVLLQRGRSLMAIQATEDVSKGSGAVHIPYRIRGFKSYHVDFYTPAVDWTGRPFGHVKGCLKKRLGLDWKPLNKEGGSCFNSSASFAQWC